MKNDTRNEAKGQEILGILEAEKVRHSIIRHMLNVKLRASALTYAYELLDDEMKELCGETYTHKEEGQMRRGGSDDGSVYIDGQRIKIKKPRARKGNKERPLDSYRALRNYDILSDDVKRLITRGISTRNYNEVIKKYKGSLGLPKSSVSRAFVKASQKSLDSANGRDLSAYTFIGMYIDGIEFAGVNLIVALGVTAEGEKLVLGLKEGGSENAEVCKDLLNSLTERGFKKLDYILITIDGSKALRKAIERVFGESAFVQRCQEHKIRNVQSYLPKSYCQEVRRRMMAAYNMNNYNSAKEALELTVRWIRNISEEAARSLEEGMEETLTVHRLELPYSLRKTFRTTNPIESILSVARADSGRVKNWKTGHDQVSRWGASLLLTHEKRMRKIQGYSALPFLIAKLDAKKLALSERIA